MPKPIKSSIEATIQSPVEAGIFGGLDFLSKEDSAKSEFQPLKTGIYQLYVDKAELIERPSYNDPSIAEKVIQLTLIVMSTQDGSTIKDIEGTEQNGGFRKLWDSLSTTAVGFKNGGTEPSKTRAAICAFTKNNPDAPFKLNSLDEVRGKECLAFVDVVNRKRDGAKVNKISKYMPL